MAPLRSPSNRRLDDPLSVDPEVDPLDLPGPHRPSWPAGLDRAIDRYPWLPESPGRMVGAAGLVILVALAGWWFLRPASAPVETSLPLASNGANGAPVGQQPATDATGATGAAGAAVTSSTALPDVVVQAAGAVQAPGVYRLPAAARVDDLVRSAGGLRPDADGDRVNLAAPLADGSRVWVPAQGETEPPEVVAGAGGGSSPTGGTGGAGGSSAGTDTPEVVDLNTATAAQLDTLPGVGPSTASAILAYRDEHGPFSSIDDLLEVRGIGDAKLEQIRPLARV